jgi:serine protease Do
MRNTQILGIIAVIIIGALLGSVSTYGIIKLLSKTEPALQISDDIDTLQTAEKIIPVSSKQNLSEEIINSRRNAIVEAAEKVGSAVVSISVIQTHIYRQTNPSFGADFWNFFFLGPREYRRQIHSLGSGIIINPEGYILTNDHVVRGAEEITITLTNGEQYNGMLIGSDESFDLAVLKLVSNKQDLPYAIMGNSDELITGEWAIAIGNPFGYLLDDTKPTVTVGVISAVNRDIKPEAGQKQVYRNMIQTDAAINPGNSGGPLVNASGEIIGINTFIFTSSRGSEGVGFAIPINRAKVIIGDLISTGEVTRSWVGMKLQRITPILAQGLGLNKKSGLIVASIDDISPAKKSGIKPGDVILKVDDEEINSSSDWEEVITYARVGSTLTITFLRDKDTLNINLIPEELPIKNAPSYTDPFGLDVVTITKQLASMYSIRDDRGVMIAGIKENSIASNWGLQETDIIRRINRTTIKDLDAYKKTVKSIRSGYKVLFVIERQGELYYLPVVL